MPICGVGKIPRAEKNSRAGILAAAQAMCGQEHLTVNYMDGAGFGFGIAPGTGAVSVARYGAMVACCDLDLWNMSQIAEKAEIADSDPALVIAALFEKYGEACLRELRGGFAIAIWDTRTSSLLLAIDQMGIRPLLYAVGTEHICFASQARGIFATGLIAKHINYDAIPAFLNFTMIPAPQTAFRDVRKLEPGTMVHWRRGVLQERRYWDAAYPEDAHGSTSHLAKRLLEKMSRSVLAASEGVEAERLGCFLSGGTDSSSVVGLLTQGTGQAVSTFSIGFQEERFNELEYAHIAARHFGTRHHEARIDAKTAFQSLDRIVDAYDEPFGNSSVIPTYHCVRLAREAGISTLLAGDGGDELFGGNERYRTDQIFQLYFRLPKILRSALEPALFATPNLVPQVARAKRYVAACHRGNPERYCAWNLLCRYRREEILDSQVPLEDPIAVVRRHYAAAPATSELNRLLYVDLKMTLADNDLPKVTHAADLLNVRVRFPYLDPSLVEFSGTLPADLKLRRLTKRYLFKKATAHLLPQEILSKKKHGFGLPIGMWLKSDPQFHLFAKDVLLDPCTYQRGYFRRSFIEWLFQQMDADQGVYFGDILWLFLILELWHRRHIEAKQELVLPLR